MLQMRKKHPRHLILRYNPLQTEQTFPNFKAQSLSAVTIKIKTKRSKSFPTNKKMSLQIEKIQQLHTKISRRHRPHIRKRTHA